MSYTTREIDQSQARLEALFGEDELMKGARHIPIATGRNPIARVIRGIRPKRIPSAKTYSRKRNLPT